MTKKWGILQRALTTQLTSDKWLVLAIARVQNLVSNERLKPGQRTAIAMGSRTLLLSWFRVVTSQMEMEASDSLAALLIVYNWFNELKQLQRGLLDRPRIRFL